MRFPAGLHFQPVNVHERAKRSQSHVGAGQPKGCSLAPSLVLMQRLSMVTSKTATNSREMQGLDVQPTEVRRRGVQNSSSSNSAPSFIKVNLALPATGREEVLHDEGELVASHPKNFSQVSPIDRAPQPHFSTLEKTKIDLILF